MDQTNDNEDAHLRQVIDLLSVVMHGRSERCIIESEGTRDEAMLVGTEGGLLGLAAVLVKLVVASRGRSLQEADCFEDEVAGETVFVTNEIKNILSEESDIWIVAACLVRDNPTLKRMITKLRANSD